MGLTMSDGRSMRVEICPNMCNFALEIRKHFEVWMQIIAYSKCYTQIL
jgi:hypothetical protein